MTNEPEKLVEKYIADNQVAYTIIIEKSFKSSSALGVTGYPSSFLVDAQGTVIWSGHPAQVPEAEIEKALKGARPPMIKLPAALKPLEALLQKRDYGKSYEAAKNLMGGKLDDEAQKVAQQIVSDIETDSKALADAAGKHIEAREFYDAVAKLEQLQKQYHGVPGADAAESRLKELQADAAIVKAIKGGEQLIKAQELERSQDYDKAYLAYRAIIKTFADTQPAEAAQKAMHDIDDGGMLGYDKGCPTCAEQKHACPKHKKKPPH